jgi:transcriptional regulator with XRE-family HTH domain
VPEVRSPTVRRRELGALLRGLRQERGLTVEQVADRLPCSPSKVSRMETGHRGATLRDLRDLCAIYDVTDQAEAARLMDLARLTHVTIQVIPFAAGAHQAMDSTFRTLEFDGPIPDVVYVEGLVRFIYTEHCEVIASRAVIRSLMNTALSPQESIKFIAKADANYHYASA